MGLTARAWGAVLALVAAASAGDDGVAPGLAFVETHCLDCHAGMFPEGGLSLDDLGRDLTDAATAAAWARAADRVDWRHMPPPERDAQPTDAERAAFVAWATDALAAAHPVGGGHARRLSRREFEATIGDLFGFEHELSDAFPEDRRTDGFDTVGEGLSLSLPFLRAAFDEATAVADRLFPRDDAAADVPSTTVTIAADELEYPARIGVDTSRVRLTLSQDLVVASCAWPVRFEAPVGGRYRVTVEASAFLTDRAHHRELGTTRRLGLFARRTDAPTVVRLDTLRPLGELLVDGADPQALAADVVLYAGETVAVAWLDSPVVSAPGRHDVAPAALVRRLESDPVFLAGWTALGYEFRGDEGNVPVERYHDEFMATAASLPTGTKRQRRLLEAARDAPVREAQGVRFGNLMRVEFTRDGPALDVHGLVVEGPLELVDDEATRAARAAADALRGEVSGDDDARLADVVDRLLPRAFRRPVDDATRAEYLRVGRAALTEHGHLDDALHAVVRTALASPRFLLRDTSGPRLDDHDLAARLSYAFTGGPPDEALRRAADAGRLSDPAGLAAEAERLVDHPERARAVRAFTRQWLGTDRLDQIMPDPRLFDVRDDDVDAMRAELEALFTTVLVDDLPVEALIDPGFTFVDDGLARLYGLDGIEGDTLRRVELPRGAARGGLLGIAATMMATANGVDTQPVLRGVWLLDAVLGDPPPPPPDDVPALGSNTSGAVDVREQLARHQVEPRCASCHARIDPFGHVLERFDPVGRLREHYPRTERDGERPRVVDGQPVRADVVLPDGTELADVADLKAYVVRHADRFARCLAGKWLTFATGRVPTYGDEHVIAEVVTDVRASGGGLRALLVALVASEAFTTR